MRPLLILTLAAAMLTPAFAAAQTAIVVDLGNNVALVVAFGADGQVIVVPNATILRIGGGPPPVDQNPYAVPSASLRTAVDPLVNFPLSRADATAMADVHESAAKAILSGQLKKLSAVKQHLIDRGKPLGLRPRYGTTGVFEALETAATKLLGLQDRDATAADADAERAIAWALWEAGR